MSTTISFVADKAFSKAIDDFIAKNRFYQSKSEFVRAAVREKLERRPLYAEEDMEAVDEFVRRLRAKVKFYKPLTPKEKDKLAMEYLESRMGKSKQ